MSVVLVMEDEPGISMVLKMALSDEGHQVFTVSDGKKGLNWMRNVQAPDIVLMDLIMPVMDGIQVLENMQASPDLKKIPVVVITGSDAGWFRMPPAERYQALINKPFDLDEVIRTVENLTCKNSRSKQDCAQK